MTAAQDREVVFVGGTGRSGTHVLGRLLGRHPRFADVPIEARFHCNKRGIPDLLHGRVTLDGFLDKLRGFWFHRVRVDGQPRGLYNLITRRHLDEAAERFAAAYHADPVGSSRELFCDLLWPLADERDAAALVEMSSHNIREAQTLRRLLPRARFVHTVRDGRDAAASVVTKTWGPDRILPAIEWWAQRLRAIDAGMTGSEDGIEYAIPPDRLCVIVLDDLVAGDREGVYARLADSVGAGDDPAMREFFEAEMSARTAHKGRWAQGLGPLGRARVRRRYERTLAALESEGNPVARPLIEAYERSG
jgi:hypothetical protein